MIQYNIVSDTYFSIQEFFLELLIFYQTNRTNMHKNWKKSIFQHLVGDSSLFFIFQNSSKKLRKQIIIKL